MKVLSHVTGGGKAEPCEEQLPCGAGERVAETSLHLPLLRRSRLHQERGAQVRAELTYEVHR